MTYNVFGGTLNIALSIYLQAVKCMFHIIRIFSEFLSIVVVETSI